MKWYCEKVVKKEPIYFQTEQTNSKIYIFHVEKINQKYEIKWQKRQSISKLKFLLDFFIYKIQTFTFYSWFSSF